jgi:hypothetical protein
LANFPHAIKDLTYLQFGNTIGLCNSNGTRINDSSISKKHGIDFADVPAIFDGTVLTILDDRFEYNETRYITFGILKVRVIVVAHTDDSQVIRIISARKALKYEEKLYFEEIGY